MTPHRQLLADYAETGSEEAFRELVTAYIGLVHGSALRLVDGQSQLAKDVAQTVFTDLARQAKKLSPEIMVGGWLHRRTCYAAANVMRSERRRLIREREAVEMNALNSDAALAWATPVLDEAINQLADDDRAAIIGRCCGFSSNGTCGPSAKRWEPPRRRRKSVWNALWKNCAGLLMRRGVVLSAAAAGPAAVGSATATAAPAGLAATISTAAFDRRAGGRRIHSDNTKNYGYETKT